ncbi:TPA: hypothetical protein RY256_002608 [Salmonella enterica]|nr:hypothetical protein [Salmonella enterica]HEB0795968.1 hypothetical protein [Salmonella enterica]HEB0806476.1 hypothetical protein [Salmonella enterica]HEB0810775.1 hypothetical protein [Salmonella enterica]HEB0815350.1 hypothetical protein [Salmonella enterica]
MKIEYQGGGEESRLLITSWFFDWREHNRLVDEILFCAPRLRAVDEGFLRRTTIISGKTAYVLCAEVVVEENGFDVQVTSYE